MKNRAALIIFLVMFMLCGGFLTFLGAQDIAVKTVLSRDWPEVNAVCQGNEPYEDDGKITGYWVRYSFFLEGKEYAVTTDYITQSPPNPGSPLAIKVNPKHPESVVFPGQKANVPLFIAGLVFLLFPLIIIAFLLRKPTALYLLFGSAFVVFGILCLWTGLSKILGLFFIAAGAAAAVTGLVKGKKSPAESAG